MIRFHLYDWISGTDGMTLEQRGAYMTLLVRMYDKKAPIKEDFETLSRACNCSQKNVRNYCRIFNEETINLLR
ncbi:YdaU family protein [Bartonella krasnovii]|uniref:DUF1376 domain-containing protein n=1 Tax=Bartonella krasnovii TaxID=2267275 RepID=UPI001F4D1D61|nr:DUF1376 domain-containing protein [Bartonella krasnovii]UNF52998.1 YdaU family protein [Bartonella krasnovii]